MKKFLVMVMVTVMVFSLFGCTSQAGAPKEIRIGVVAPLSGQSAIAGEYMKNGISLITDELEANGGLEVNGKKMPVKIIYEDNEAKPEATANVYRKLIDQDKVLAIVGPGYE